MREIIFDTETTGIRPDLGHRIIELGAVELIDGEIGASLQLYFNPERKVDAGAFEVHGISDEFLADKPRFSEKLADMLDFFGDDPLIAHNADFDRGFLNNEFRLADYPAFPTTRFIDTLKMSRQRYKSGRHSLDALCARLDIENTDRVLHGALKDSVLLAQAYLKMTAGEQHTMRFDSAPMEQVQKKRTLKNTKKADFSQRRVAALSTDAAIVRSHQEFVADNITDSLWVGNSGLRVL